MDLAGLVELAVKETISRTEREVSFLSSRNSETLLIIKLRNGRSQ